MSHKKPNFVRENIRHADHYGEDAIADFMKNRSSNTNNSKRHSTKNVKPINAKFYDHLNDKSKTHEPLFTTSNKEQSTKNVNPISNNFYNHLNDKSITRQPLFTTKPKTSTSAKKATKKPPK